MRDEDEVGMAGQADGQTSNAARVVAGAFKAVYFAGLFFLTVPNIIYGLVAYEFHQEVDRRAEALSKVIAETQESADARAGDGDRADAAAPGGGSNSATAPAPGTPVGPDAERSPRHPIDTVIPQVSADFLLARSQSNFEALRAYSDLLGAGRARVGAAESGLPPGEVAQSLGLRSALLEAYGTAVSGARLFDGPGDITTTVFGLELARAQSLAVFSVYVFDPGFYTALPTWALAPIVTVLAGILGSLIFVLQAVLRTYLQERRFGSPRKPWPAHWFFLRPLLGVVTALGGYVVVQTGLLGYNTIADLLGEAGRQAVGTDAYVMVFVGLISGLLCWHMIEFLERQGERMLGTGARPAWGYGLAGAFAAAEARGETRESIARDCGTHPQMLADWIALRVPVPKDMQSKLAVTLRTEPESLFVRKAPWELGLTAATAEDG